MRGRFAVCVLSVAIGVLASPRAGLCDVLDPAVQFGWGYITAPADWLGGVPPPDGAGPMTVVGFVESFHPIFGDLDPSTDSEEYTFAYQDVGFDYSFPVDDPERSLYGWGALFSGGTLSVFKDATPDAVVGDEITFEDGDLLLAATVIEITIVRLGQDEPSWWGTVRFTGGTLFPIVSSGGAGYVADNIGSFVPEGGPPTPCGGAWPGAVACTRSALSLTIPTSIETKTWGAIKGLYR